MVGYKKIPCLFKSVVVLSLGFLFMTYSGCDSHSTTDKETWDSISAQTERATISVRSDEDEILDSRTVEMNGYPVPKPPFSKGVYPCSTCHSVLPDNFVKRVLTKDHTEIKLVHGPREKWCFDCHIQNHRDKLRLSSGSTVLFSESYKLCGQCHGPKLRDWRAGIHGKRTGYWNGTKQYLLCAHCHDPHSPRFKPVSPEPAPKRSGVKP